MFRWISRMQGGKTMLSNINDFVMSQENKQEHLHAPTWLVDFYWRISIPYQSHASYGNSWPLTIEVVTKILSKFHIANPLIGRRSFPPLFWGRDFEGLTTTWLRLLRDLICVKHRNTKSGATEGIAIWVWIDPTVHEHRHRESEIQKWSAEASVHLWTHHFKGWASELAWGLCFCGRPVQAPARRGQSPRAALFWQLFPWHCRPHTPSRITILRISGSSMHCSRP